MDLSVRLIYNNTDVDLPKEQSKVEAHHNCFPIVQKAKLDVVYLLCFTFIVRTLF